VSYYVKGMGAALIAECNQERLTFRGGTGLLACQLRDTLKFADAAYDRIAQLEAEIETRDNQWAVLNGMSQSRAAQLETTVEAFQAACEHPREDWFYHSGVSKIENDFRCNKCNLVFNVPEDELSNTSWKPHKPSGGA
jgi:hypothetical protein